LAGIRGAVGVAPGAAIAAADALLVASGRAIAGLGADGEDADELAAGSG
jgi:hypothetical protein